MDILEYIKQMQEMYGDQASLADDLEPGALKDELLKDFDPSQETYEEYLQRKSLERPFNMADGGVIGKPGGLVEENIGYYGKTIELTKDQKKLFNQYKKFFPNAKDSAVSIKVRNNQITEDTITKLKKGISLKATDKDKTALDADTIKKIKEKIKLKPGQKWNFYDPNPNSKTYNPTGHTYGIKKSDNKLLYDQARNIGKPGRAEKKLKQAQKTYKKIKADPDLLAQKKLYDREIYMGKREKVLEDLQFKYTTDKDFREGKLEWARQDRIKNPEKYKKKVSDYYAKKGSFPPGNNYKENVWRDMFRSSQKAGQERFLLVDESGKLLTPDNFPKVNGRVRWDVGGAYKKVKFYDTQTEQFVKFDNTIKGKGLGFEKYLDQKEVGGKGAFKNAVHGYKIKDDYKNLTFKDSKGKTIRLGTFIQNQLIDGSDFIKSGINVQHADLNNAFWKNEVSLASSNQELNKFEMNVERKLRAANKIDDVKLKNIAKNKALGTFKKEIEKLPGGITKVIEGTTYGIKPTERGLIRAAGKEFGATRYKDFANLLKKLCPKGQASGGRIGYQDAGVVGKTLQCGLNQFNKNMKTGNANSALMRRILANGGNILTSAGKQLNPAELLKLRNLIGPQALGFLAAYEAGVITDDVLRKGTPLNESVAKNWLTKSFVPFSEEFARQKNLLKSGTLNENQRIYALDMMKAEKAFKEMDRIEGMERDQLVEGTMDDDFIFNSQEKIDAAKTNVNRIVEDLDSRDSFRNTGKQMENIRAMDEMEASRMAKKRYSPFFGKLGTPLVNKLAAPSRKRTGPMTAKREMKIDYSLPTYDRMETPTDQDILNKYRQYGIISPTEFKTGVLQPGEGTIIRMMQGGKGLYGTQFATGGMVGDKSGPPPTGGPMSQGLRSLYNNGRKL
jgi:hypothetical protein